MSMSMPSTPVEFVSPIVADFEDCNYRTTAKVWYVFLRTSGLLSTRQRGERAL